MTDDYQPPRDILEVLQQIEYEEPLGPDDPRYVDTREARGSQRTLDRLARKLGLLLADGRMYPPRQKHVLFFGHTGSGKTTELLHYATQLEGPGRFCVVQLDITKDLDRNNLQYADTLMAMARALLHRLDSAGVDLGADALAPLQAWFGERVLTTEAGRELRTEIKTGAEGKGGIPGLVKLFASFTAAFKANATYKDELRRVIRNSFGELAAAFNTLIERAEDALRDTGNGNRVVFMIDGTDKLRGEDTRQFFVHDAEQLLAIETLVVYTAPLSLKYEGNLAGNDERTRRLLYNLALLEYNDGTWRRSHPVVRTLEGYARAAEAAAETGN